MCRSACPNRDIYGAGLHVILRQGSRRCGTGRMARVARTIKQGSPAAATETNGTTTEVTGPTGTTDDIRTNDWYLRVVVFVSGGVSIGIELAASRLLAPFF